MGTLCQIGSIQQPGKHSSETGLQAVGCRFPCSRALQEMQQVVCCLPHTGPECGQLFPGVASPLALDSLAGEKDRPDLSVLHTVPGQPELSVQYGTACQCQ